MKPLRLRDEGLYARLLARPNPDRSILVTMPSLVATLVSSEKARGASLNQQEVETIRDTMPTVVSTDDAAKAVEEGRGYKDIDPGQAWRQWKLRQVQFQ